MAKTRFYGIKFPFLRDSEHLTFLDLNERYEDSIKSKILHIMFTPKGQRLRMPLFGSDLVKYIFEPNDDITLSEITENIRESIHRYLPNVNFDSVNVYEDEENEHAHIVTFSYTVTEGNMSYKKNFGIRI